MKNALRSITVILVGALCAICTWLPCPGCRNEKPDPRLHILQQEIIATRAEVVALAAAAEERVIDLPEDGNQWHTILLVSPNWKATPTERRAEAAFHSEPLLVSLKQQTHWHLITSDKPEFQKFRPLVDALPCLIVERCNGEVIYRESGPDLGKRPHGLVRAVKKEVQRHCPDGHCLPLHPVPGPNEPAPVDDIPTVLQDQPEAPAKKPANPLPAIAVAGAALIGGFARKFRKAAGF